MTWEAIREQALRNQRCGWVIISTEVDLDCVCLGSSGGVYYGCGGYGYQGGFPLTVRQEMTWLSQCVEFQTELQVVNFGGYI